MICYPEVANESEIKAIDDYWLLSERPFIGFRYTIKQIDEHYKPQGIRPISFLAKNSNFISSHPAFTCQDCKQRIPAQNRRDYTSRTETEDSVICHECVTLKRQRIIDNAHTTIKGYKAEHFRPVQYLETLTTEESLALLSISSELTENNIFVGESPEDILITGVPSLDQQLLFSLIRKKALVNISEVPPEVEYANKILYGQFERLTYDHRYRNRSRYKHPDSIAPGVYLNLPILDEELSTSGVSSLLYQNLQCSTLSTDEAARVHHIIKEIQLGKLYQLIIEITKEFKIPVDNSNPLRALLNHLAEHYAPLNVHFTFNVKAKDTVVHMRTEAAPPYIEKHFFAKFVGDYIHYIESKGWGLKRTWSLPSRILTSPFEALFSQLYLNGHFDWNRLSAKDIVALWLENVRLSADAQELLTDGSPENSTLD